MMLAAFIRLLKFLVLIVPILVAIIDCNDRDDDKDKDPTVYAELPLVMAPPTPGVLIIDLQDGSTQDDLYDLGHYIFDSYHEGYGYQVHDVPHHFPEWVHPEAEDEALASVYVPNIRDAMNTIGDLPIVEVVEPRMTMHTLSTLVEINLGGYPNDPLYEKQWHMDAMGAPYGWEHTPRGKGVIVAVADTGVTVVQDLKNTHVLPGKSFVGGSPSDGHGHGTHVSGTIAQSTNNGVGTTGVAPEATILPVKVLTDGGFGSSDGIATGIDWAVDQGAQVINLSLGGGYSSIIHNAIKKADAAGVLVIAACGNSNIAECDYPGGLKETIGISATGPEGERSFYSSYGKGVDIAAPGGDKRKGEEGGVLQNTVNAGGTAYEYYQGTSMATPHVVGAAAVLLSTGLTKEQTEEILLQTADDSDDNPREFGQGKLDLEAAVQAAGGDPAGNGHNHMGLFVVAGLLALAITVFSETSRQFMVKTAVASSILGGGLFFLADIPFLSGTLVTILSTPLLEWPNLILWSGAAGFPLWASAALPVLLAFVFGMNKYTRPLAAGLAFGFGANLLWAAAAGSMPVWALPGILGTVWLTANGVACTALGMAVCGSQHLEEVHDV